MPTSRLPLDVKNFLMENIDSVSHLEVLLMLLAAPSDTFSADAVCRELRSNIHSAANQLSQLASKGLLKTSDGILYQYGPSSDELDSRVKTLLEFYKEMPVAVVTSIYEKPKDKLRDFSNAFKLKKD